MNEIFHILPTDWEMLYIGHCAQEDIGEFIAETTSNFKLYKSTRPPCLHAYGITSSGARKLLKELINPSEPIDVEIIRKITSGIITSYSLEPKAIVQWKSSDNPSDVSPGDFQWTYPLKNSTLHSLGYKET
ncbi:17632_t:CDS:1 [Racocetra fulgida]|uniref:17632_t:CDS:1 n=1 Tax=Racocetra fulgida TaxID=60492 RepID=A0A9N9FVV0_9GLOM|nr:17632_t:CDS:1 [Racocetra fulgida]